MKFLHIHHFFRNWSAYKQARQQELVKSLKYQWNEILNLKHGFFNLENMLQGGFMNISSLII